MDGKYVKVGGCEQKIPFIYGIDYLTHDLPLGNLYTAEDEMSFVSFFARLKELDYPLRAVVADDRKGLKTALLRVFPKARLQLCHTHYLENIRRRLNIRTNEQYHEFFLVLRKIFRRTRNTEHILTELRFLKEQSRSILHPLIWEIQRRFTELFAFRQINNCPNTTNLIESYNSHLQGRLKTIKGFQGFLSAKQWLNAYLIRRRTKPLTDCGGGFKYLNGHASLELTIKKQAHWPDILTKLNIKKINYFDQNKH